MYNHAPQDYDCPICLGVKHIENDNTLLRRSDIVFQNSYVTAFINSFFVKNNKGHVIIVPNEHYENLYDLPVEVGSKIIELSQEVAKAMKENYQCDGIAMLQNNEPASNQHAFHYHMHLFPRYTNDDFYGQVLRKISTTPEERKLYADKLKAYFESSKKHS